MSSAKSIVDRVRSLETEKSSLSVEVENLKKMADAKADGLANEIVTLREEINTLKILMGQEKQVPPPSEKDIAQKNLASLKELVDKTVEKSNKLGNQVFVDPPFSRYFDPWLADMHQIASDFECNCPVKMDEQFVKDSSQVFLDVEAVLAQKKVEESTIGTVAKTLADTQHLLVETDREYAEKARELALKRDSEIERLTNRVQQMEREVQNQKANKRNILKKKPDDKPSQAMQNLKSAEEALEFAQKDFAAEQDKLHESYEKNKREVTAQAESLRTDLERLETDTSTEARQEASKAYNDALIALEQRASLAA
ncbi:MAG TPA: hypothetical protein VK536_00880 [Candidatus Limnocylindrales bacterium]|nr:hypothetical protein [Candidatus Limnocylindrales bacterium]